MGKGKLAKFEELRGFGNVLQPVIEDYVHVADHPLKGRWKRDFFRNDHPLVLELACGKGEYTVALGRNNPGINYLGVDIKGARIWRGAKTAHEENLHNVGFLRIRIELLAGFFAAGEISEIWITFPDPQPGKPNKRLTSPRFLSVYQPLLHPQGSIHLKTDNRHFFYYTRAVLEHNGMEVLACTDDLYSEPGLETVKSIKTFYENQFLEKGSPINYLKFKLPGQQAIEKPDFDEKGFLSTGV